MVEHHDFRPDCNHHGHFSKGEARELINAGKVRFVSPRAVVAVSSGPLPGYWYDEVAKKDDRRYLGTAKSGTAQLGWARTHQLVNFMPRAMKHTVKDIEACGAHQRRMSAIAVNGRGESFAENGE
jgi:hypothetical protein